MALFSPKQLSILKRLGKNKNQNQNEKSQKEVNIPVADSKEQHAPLPSRTENIGKAAQQ